MRLLIIGNPEEFHVGAHLFRAALDSGIEPHLSDVRHAFEGPMLWRRIHWRIFKNRPLRLNRFSQSVLDDCQAFHPDVILTTGIAPVTQSVLNQVGIEGITRFNFLTDDPWNRAHYAPWFLRALPCYDHVFSPRRSNLADLRAHGCRDVSWLPFAYSPELHAPWGEEPLRGPIQNPKSKIQNPLVQESEVSLSASLSAVALAKAEASATAEGQTSDVRCPEALAANRQPSILDPPSSISDSLPADLLFTGGADADRIPYFDALAKAGFDVHLYGDYWDRYAPTRPLFRGYADPHQMPELVAHARICLGLVRRANRDGHSMRTFEVPAMKGCFLVEETEDHREFFGPDGECVLFFRNIPEMIQKARWLLDHPNDRQRLAETCHQRIVGGKNTYADRLRMILQPIDHQRSEARGQRSEIRSQGVTGKS